MLELLEQLAIFLNFFFEPWVAISLFTYNLDNLNFVKQVLQGQG